MSTYFNKRTGAWRYDFTLKGQRYTQAGYRTKREAVKAEQHRRDEILNPPPPPPETPIDMAFFELVNRRLDYVKAYNSNSHYRDHRSLAKKWVLEWGELSCSEISTEMIQVFLLKQSEVSNPTANKHLRCLRTLFNFGIEGEWIENNPTRRLKFMPIEKRERYIPPAEDLMKVIDAAEPEMQDYLWTLRETLARVSEINRLEWKDVDFTRREVTLYTRKKRGGSLTPRRVPMTNKLHDILARRFKDRDKGLAWVFHHRYWDRRSQCWIDGPYVDRKKIMRTLCSKAGVEYFRYHPIRHQGASLMDSANVSIGAIQRILGHENRSTTEIYLHSIGNPERDAMRAFEALTEKSHTESHTEIDCDCSNESGNRDK